MANGNTSAGRYLAFPTFGGGGGGGGITQVKLPAAQMRFPTARGPVRRAPEPTLKETLAPFLPIALEGIGSLLKKDPEKLTDEKYLADLGGLSDDPTVEAMQGNKKKLARLEAYKLYGEPEEKDGFGFDDILSMVIGSQMGRGAADYAASSRAIDKAKETSRLTKQTNRGNFLNTALKDVNNLQFATFVNTDSAKVGVDDPRTGLFDPAGEAYVMNDDKTGYTNIKSLKGNWIEQNYTPTNPLSFQMRDPRLVELTKNRTALGEKDNALIGTMTLTNEMVKMLDKGIADPEQNPLTTVTSIGNFLNSAKANANQILSFMGKGNVSNAFATAEDIQDGIAGSDGREGSGQLAQQLYNAVSSGDDNQMKLAMAAFEEGNEGTNFESLLGDMAYSDVRTRATMLQLAYAAAAANGQTGRTLSDKDLAFHLQMVGFGATQDAQTAKDNILSFVDTLVRQTDNVVMGTISQNRLMSNAYPLDNDMFTSIISGYWEPPVINGERDFTKPSEYTFKNFYTRFGKIPDVVRYKKHTRRSGTMFDPSSNTSSGTVNSSDFADDDLSAVSDLY